MESFSCKKDFSLLSDSVVKLITVVFIVMKANY